MPEELKRFQDMNKKVNKFKDIEVSGKAVLVRGDFDVDDLDNPRIFSVRQIVERLIELHAGKIKVIGHSETGFDVVSPLKNDYPDVEFDDQIRKNPGEKSCDMEYAKKLCEGFDVYVNEAFATSHRSHASIVGVPKVMKDTGRVVAMGIRFEKEIEMLDQVWSKMGRRVLVIGGTKVEDKQKFAEMMGDKFAVILKGGLLPGVNLREDGLDISDEAIEKYVDEIGKAEVILAAGVMGKYEDSGSQKGTKTILEAIANSGAYKVAGGGDIERAIDMFGLVNKFDWISVGGGAMLSYLQKGNLVGIEALE